MKIVLPFESALNDRIITNILNDNSETNFTIGKKIYYSFIRKIIPYKLRNQIQKVNAASISHNDNFIDESLINEMDIKKSTKELYPGGEKYAIVLTHDVETENGFQFIPKIMELEKKYDYRSSWNIVPYKYKIDDNIIKLIRSNDDEIGIHGYNHDGKLYYSFSEFKRRAYHINNALEKYEAVGFRSPMVHRKLDWIQLLNIKYDSSFFDYDPYQPFPGGIGIIWPFIAGKIVELPYTMPQDHTLFCVLKEKTIKIWEKKSNWLVKNNGVILVLTHPDYLINKHNFKMYEDLLKHLRGFSLGWFCLPKELADWCEQKTLKITEKSQAH
jgi:peptidoglycan/xylan/chitin deacetylase (PgdA/CDA1 family)